MNKVTAKKATIATGSVTMSAESSTHRIVASFAGQRYEIRRGEKYERVPVEIKHWLASLGADSYTVSA